MLNSLKRQLFIILCKLNVVYPALLGFGFFKYKRDRLKANYTKFDASKEVLDIVNNAIKDVPYYKEKYKHQINSIQEFEEKIDFIDKDTVMLHWNNFQSSKTKPSNIVSGTTGGTSGKPLKLNIPKNRYVFELSTIYDMWGRVGWNGHIRAVLRNAKLNDNEPFRVDPIKREFIFDGFRTNDAYYFTVYNTIKKYGIKFLHAYPSSAYQFSLFLKRNNLDTSIFKAFLCGSEGLLKQQKALIEDDLGIKVYHWYGHSEKLILGGICAHNDAFHLEPTYGYFELIDENGAVIDTPNVIGEIVGTTLHNPFMPLIRYKTGDYAEYSGNYCDKCSRELPLITNVQGRWDKNKVYLKDKTYTTITALNLHSDLYHHINGLQYLQREIGVLEVYLIKDVTFNEKVEIQFINFFKSVLGDNCDFNLNYVSEIKREENGKFLPLKQYIDI